MTATTINPTTSIDRLYILSIFDDSGEFESPITVYSVKANNLKEAKDKFFKILKNFIEKLIKQHVYITEGDEFEDFDDMVADEYFSNWSMVLIDLNTMENMGIVDIDPCIGEPDYYQKNFMNKYPNTLL